MQPLQSSATSLRPSAQVYCSWRDAMGEKGERSGGHSRLSESDERARTGNTVVAEKESKRVRCACVRACVWKGGRGAWPARGICPTNFLLCCHSRIIFDWDGMVCAAWSLSIQLILSHRGVVWRGRGALRGWEQW